MGLFKDNKKVGFFADVIRCDEPSYLIWKWHPDGTTPGEHKREYAIRWGSSLRVKDGEVAVFVYKQKDGTMQDFIVGPFDQKLETKNFPVLSTIIGWGYGKDTPFQAEVYFINIATVQQINFGVPYFDVFDPRFTDFAVPVAVRGTLSFKIEDYKAFVKAHRLFDFNHSDFQSQIKDALIRYIKGEVVNIPIYSNIPVVQIERQTKYINDIIEESIMKRLTDCFAVKVTGVDINTIEIDKSSDDYRQLLIVTKDIAGAMAKAETEAKIKDIHTKQRIEAEHYEGALRLQREQRLYSQRMRTRTENIGAYTIEKHTEIGVAGAAALGKMGENGAGNISIGGDAGGSGFNAAALMTNIAMGSVVGQNIAQTMSNAMSGMNNPASVPPPIPKITYMVAKNGTATGPFDLDALNQLVLSGDLLPESLVWTQGMSMWERADSINEIKSFFPPKIPN